jgi:hypothetical protein
MLRRRRLIIGLLALLGACAAAERDAPPLEASRADILGCWQLSGMRDEPTPDIVRLDSTAVTVNAVPGRRAVRRIDKQGHVIQTDGEGLAFIDHWTADSTSDTVRLFLANEFLFFGSHWALAYRGNQRGTLRGRSRAFADVPQDSPYPERAVTAVRIDCPVATDTTPDP